MTQGMCWAGCLGDLREPASGVAVSLAALLRAYQLCKASVCGVT